MTGTIYNSTDGPLPYDRAGRMLAAREHVDVDDLSASPVAGHVAAGRFVVTSKPEGEPVEADEQPASGDDSASEETPAPEPQPSAKRRRGGSQTPAPSTQEA